MSVIRDAMEAPRCVRGSAVPRARVQVPSVRRRALRRLPQQARRTAPSSSLPSWSQPHCAELQPPKPGASRTAPSSSPGASPTAPSSSLPSLEPAPLRPPPALERGAGKSLSRDRTDDHGPPTPTSQTAEPRLLIGSLQSPCRLAVSVRGPPAPFWSFHVARASARALSGLAYVHVWLPALHGPRHRLGPALVCVTSRCGLAAVSLPSLGAGGTDAAFAMGVPSRAPAGAGSTVGAAPSPCWGIPLLSLARVGCTPSALDWSGFPRMPCGPLQNGCRRPQKRFHLARGKRCHACSHERQQSTTPRPHRSRQAGKPFGGVSVTLPPNAPFTQARACMQLLAGTAARTKGEQSCSSKLPSRGKCLRRPLKFKGRRDLQGSNV